MYLCKFDEDGRRTATVLKGIHFKKDKEKEKYLSEGYVETSEEDYQYYVGNRGNGENGTGYVRDKSTGKPVSAPPYVQSKEEKLTALDSQYEADKKELTEYFNMANLSGDAQVMEELREELSELDSTYAEERQTILES